MSFLILTRANQYAYSGEGRGAEGGEASGRAAYPKTWPAYPTVPKIVRKYPKMSRSAKKCTNPKWYPRRAQEPHVACLIQGSRLLPSGSHA